MCVRVGVCVCEREIDREREKEMTGWKFASGVCPIRSDDDDERELHYFVSLFTCNNKCKNEKN